MRRQIGIMVMVAATAALVTGCGDDDTSSSPVSDVSTDAESDNQDTDESDLDLGDAGDIGVTVENDEQSISVGADLPDDFPDAVVLPDGYQILQAQERDYGGLRGWIVIGQVDDSTAAVRSDLVDEYGEPDEDLEQDGVLTLRWLDVDGYTAQFTLTPNADGNAAVSINAQEF